MHLSSKERRRKIKELIDKHELSFEFFRTNFGTTYPTYAKYKAGDSSPRNDEYDEIEKFVLSGSKPITTPESVVKPPGEVLELRNLILDLKGQVRQLTEQVQLVTEALGVVKDRLDGLEGREKKRKANGTSTGGTGSVPPQQATG